MTYLEAHEGVLKERHYITDAKNKTHWFNFYAGKLADYRSRYGDEFCLAINCSAKRDDAYVIPFGEVKEMLTQAYLSDNRWIGTVINESFAVSFGGQPMNQMFVSNFHNAFDLLQGAPNPVPKRQCYD